MTRRDLRDPEKLGNYILNEVRAQKKPASAVYDNNVQHFNIPDVTRNDSLCKVTQAEYRAELEARVAEGDKYAQSALAMLNDGELPKR